MLFNIGAVNKVLDLYCRNMNHVDLAKKSVQLGVITSVFLVLIKVTAWYVTGSISLCASMTDSLMDAFTSFALFQALRYSNVKFDKEHNFGHEKVEGVVSIFQCLIIFYSGIKILTEAYEAISQPQEIQNTAWGIAIMIVSTIAVYQLLYFQNYAASKTDSMLVKGDSLHYLSDFCMNLGVIASLILSKFFGYVDVVFGSAVGLYILYSVSLIMKNALIDLMDEALPEAAQKKIKQIVADVDGVKEIKLLRTRSAGMKKYIEVRIRVDANLNILEACKITREVECQLSGLYEKLDVLVKPEV
ncbi:MAG: cation transporter [Alphaproteobacteria bacterium]|nr:cation transporter [Alphaproteobacteria bacterium]